MIKPNLIIPGFPKSGTSSVFAYLAQHPRIYGSKSKEPHTYSRREKFENREQVFEQIYMNSDNFDYVMDASTSYMISEFALKRIYKDTPNAKVIIVARDPIERIVSHYNWIRSLGIPAHSFKKEIAESLKEKFDINKNYRSNYKNYVEFSKYGSQIERCLEIFPTDQVLILPFELIKNDFNTFMDKICHFLKIEPIVIIPEIKNKTKLKVTVSGNMPTPISRLKKLIPSNIRPLVKQWLLTNLFSKKIQKTKISENEKEWLYDLLKDDIDKMYTLGITFKEWTTVNKIRENAKHQ